MAAREFVLANIPKSCWESGNEFIIDYVENTLNIDVEKVELCPYLPERALVIGQHEIQDYCQMAKTISETPLESQKLEVFETHPETAVVVEDLDVTKLSEEFACLYFESVFAEGRAVISSSHSWPEQNLTIFRFKTPTASVVKKILEQAIHLALPSENYKISVGPFYHNFHDQLEQVLQDKCKSSSEEESDRSQSDEEEDEDTDREEENEIEKPDLSGNEHKRSKHIIAGDGIHKNPNKAEEVTTDSDSNADSDDDEDNKINRKEEKESEEESDRPQSDEEEDEDTDGEEDNEIKKPDLSGNEYKRKKHIMAEDGIHKNLNKAEEISSDSHSNADSDDEGENRGDLEKVKEMETESGSSYSGEEQEDEEENEEEDETETGEGAKRKAIFTFAGLAADRKLRKISARGKYRQRQDIAKERQGRSPDSKLFDTNNLMASQAKIAKPTDLSIKPSIRRRGGAIYRASRDKTSHRSVPADVEEREFSKTPAEEHMHHDHQMIKSRQKPVEKSEIQQLHTPYEQAISDTNEMRRTDLEEKLKEVNEENARLREKQKVTTENITVDAWQFELLSDFFGQIGGCRVYYSCAKKTACLEGPEDEVRERHKDLLRAMKDCKYEEIQLIPTVQSFISSERGKVFLNNLQSSELKGVKLFHHEKSLIITSRENDILDTAIDKLRKRLNYKETRLSTTPLPIDKIILLKAQLEKKLLVGISWVKNVTRILVEGVKDDVIEAMKDVDNFLDENGEDEIEFSVSGGEAKFMSTYMSHEINSLIKSPEVEITNCVMTNQNVTITLKGKRCHTNLIYRRLEHLKTELTTKQWNIKSEWRKNEDLWLLTQGFQSQKVQERIKTFEHKNKCFVIPALPKLESFKTNTVSQRKPVKSSITSQRGSQQQPRPSTSNSVNENLNFSLTPTCEIVIKSNGDIVEDTSDLLVSILDTNIDMRKTRVGRAFNKMCPSLWKQLQAEQEAHPTDQVLTTKFGEQFGGLKCQAVCHVILSPWDPNTSPAQLDNAVKSVLKQAISLGVKSVSFPPLGCGRAFQFPPPQVAQIVIASIKSETLGKALNRITLLAPDLELFRELNIAASNNSLTPIPHSRGAVGGSEQDIDGTDSSSSEDDEDSDDDKQTEVILRETSSWNICIVATHGSGLERMWSQLKQEIDKLCLHTDYFNQNIVEFCPREIHEKIIGKAKELSVWVQKSPNPQTRKLGYSIKGERNVVEQMQSFIRQELCKISKHMPKKRIHGCDTPRRGTREFLKHATESDEPFPSYWKLNKSEATWTLPFFKRNKILVKVNSQTEAAIKKLITQTFDPSMTKAKRSRQKSIEVIEIRRAENSELFEAYQSYRKQLFKTWLKQGKICPDIGKLSGSKGRVITTEQLDDFMKRELYYEVNEHYLFHDTSKEAIEALSKKGIDPSVSSGKAKFGEKVMSDPQDKQSDKGVVVLARILLGNVFIDNPQRKTGASPDLQRRLHGPHVYENGKGNDICMACEPVRRN